MFAPPQAPGGVQPVEHGLRRRTWPARDAFEAGPVAREPDKHRHYPHPRERGFANPQSEDGPQRFLHTLLRHGVVLKLRRGGA